MKRKKAAPAWIDVRDGPGPIKSRYPSWNHSHLLNGSFFVSPPCSIKRRSTTQLRAMANAVAKEIFYEFWFRQDALMKGILNRAIIGPRLLNDIIKYHQEHGFIRSGYRLHPFVGSKCRVCNLVQWRTGKFCLLIHLAAWRAWLDGQLWRFYELKKKKKNVRAIATCSHMKHPLRPSRLVTVHFYSLLGTWKMCSKHVLAEYSYSNPKLTVGFIIIYNPLGRLWLPLERIWNTIQSLTYDDLLDQSPMRWNANGQGLIASAENSQSQTAPSRPSRLVSGVYNNIHLRIWYCPISIGNRWCPLRVIGCIPVNQADQGIRL